MPEPLDDAVRHSREWNEWHPSTHHWVESVDDPNVLVEVKP